MCAILSVKTRGHIEQGQKSPAEKYICLWKYSKSQRRGKLFLGIRKLNVSAVAKLQFLETGYHIKYERVHWSDINVPNTYFLTQGKCGIRKAVSVRN